VALREFTVANEYQYNQSSPLRWIVSHILRYPLLPIGLFLGTIATTGLFSYGSLLIGQAFDLILAPNVTLEQLWSMTLLIFAVRVIAPMIELIRIVCMELLAQRMERDAREELYINLLGKSQTFHNRQQVGDIMARATNDVQMLNLMVSPGIALISESMLFLLMPMIGIAMINTQLLIIPLLYLVVFGFALRHYSTQLDPVSNALREQFGGLNARLAESVSGIEVVKGYAQELQEKRIFSKNARQYRDLFVQEGNIKARYLPLLLFGIAYGAAFGHALIMYLNGQLTIGDVVGFTGLFGIIRFPTFMSLFTFSLVQMGVAGARRILELIKTESELDENVNGYSAPIQGEIRFENVSFGYQDEGDSEDDLILKNISFTAKAGQTIAIVGQTGSGKSTLTKLVNRTYDATEGRVLIDGVDVRDWSIDSLRSQISTIEQDIFLFTRTIGENIAFGASGQATQAQIEQAAQEAQAEAFIQSMPEGYNTMVGERGVTLSGGQRQRLAIARAFLTNPRILVLDDSTSAIDSATEDEIQRAMRRILKDRTTLLITHRISQIRWADHILVMRRGELVAQGTHDELIESSEAYRRIFARYSREKVAV
jgi:ATP-binding cassette subfamily B protein